MQELYNRLKMEKNPLEIIKICDELLDNHIYGYIKLMFLKGEILLSLGRIDDALFVFKQILEYNDDRFTGRTHYSLGFCYSIKNGHCPKLS